MPPKVLYFDIGMVLVEYSYDIMCAQMGAAAGITAEAVWDALFGSQENVTAITRYESGKLTTDEFFDHFCQVTGTRPDRKRLADAVCDIFQPIEPMFELVRELADAGNRLALLSNTNPLQWNFLRDGRFPVMAVGQAVSAFDWAIVSYEVGIMKPEPGIYEAAARRAAAPPQNVFFTDDRAENVEGARAAGIDAVQYVDRDSLVAKLRERNVPGT
ncbi:MAG: HAD family hydrolase [Pirellulales bacterium]